MKNKIILFFILFLGSLTACNKYSVHNTDDQVGISKVTHYVVLNLIGNAFESVVVGGSYQDPGATAEENGAAVQYTVTGSVDFNVPGIYNLVYSAVNKDGYSSSITRKVAVIPEADDPSKDISGTYANVGSAALTAEISKVAPGVYFTSNCWGGGSTAVIQAYFFCTDGINITIPEQTSAAGRMNGSGTYTAGLIAWTIDLEDQGPLISLKKWQQQ
mgnify:CR=1 FL=1